MDNSLNFCRQIPLFASLPEEDWQTVAAHFPSPQTIPAGAPLLPASQNALLLLLDGQAVVCASGHDRTAVMRKLGPGDICGVATLFGDPVPVSEVTAVTACKVITLSRAIITRCLQESFAFTENYIAFLTDRIRFLNRRIANYTEDSADERLLYYIREHLDKDGEFSPPGSMTELAHILHVGRSSLYRAFEHLAAQGFLEEIATKRWKYKEEIL